MADILFYLQIEILLLWLALGILAFSCGLWLVHLIAIIYGKWKLHRKVNTGPREVPLPPISILKPLMGIDANLFTNLETFFTLQYPKFELLFCVHESNDPALMVVQSLIKRYPNVDARIFTGGQNVGVNPKVNNLMPGYEAAKYDIIMIADAGIRMKKDTLQDMAEAMGDKVGIVTQMPFTCDRKGFAATLEKVFFGTGHARIYLSADFCGVVCSTGMSSLIRKPALEDLGGLRAFGMYIAEDYFFARHLHAKGWKCAISSQPAWQNGAGLSVGRFHDRVCRWAKLRIAMLPQMILLEPLQDCMLLGLLCSWAVNVLFQWNSLVFFLIHVLAWMLLDYVLLSVVQNGPLPFGKFEYVISWLYRELTALPTFLKALCRPQIRWKGPQKYRLKWGGKAEEIRTSRRPELTEKI